jgi:hypothetical protein
MTWSNVDYIVDRALHASMGTYLASFAAASLLVAFGLWIAARLTPKKKIPEEELQCLKAASRENPAGEQ